MPTIQLTAADIEVLAAGGTVTLGIVGPAPAPPPPPAPSLSFKSVTEVVRAYTDGPPAGAPGTFPVLLHLHASGDGKGSGLIYGPKFKALCSTALGHYDNNEFFFTLRRYVTTDGRDMFGMAPIDGVSRVPYPGLMQTYWFGYSTDTANRVAYAYTEARLDALYEWTFANYPQMSRTKVTATGASMGGIGCLVYVLRRPHMFAAAFALIPRWQTDKMYELESGIATLAVDVPISGKSETYGQHMDAVAYVADTRNKIPFLGWAFGRLDSDMPVAEQHAGIRACKAAKRAFVASWNNGDHSAGPDAIHAIYATYNPADFEIGKGYPILMNSSLDQPLSALMGGINLGFRWRNVTESAAGWSCEISNAKGAVEVDVLPYSSIYTGAAAEQHLSIPAGQWARVAWPAPPPPPPDPVAAPVLAREPVSLSQLVVFNSQHAGSRYERFQRFLRLEGQTTLDFHGENISTGGALRPLVGPSYTLRIDGEDVQTVPTIAGQIHAAFTVDAALLKTGWHTLKIVCPLGESSATWYGYSGPGPSEVAPVASGTYDMTHAGGAFHHHGLVKPGAPTPRPLVPRECPEFNTALLRSELHRENIIPVREGNIRRVNTTADGVLSTFNMQAYFWSRLIQKLPDGPLLDGPRGVGTLQMPTAGLVTRQGDFYFADPWRVGRCTRDGTIRTALGYRHKHPPSQYEGPADLELVGDWSAIPFERHGFHEIWGMAFVKSTLVTDPNAPPVDGEQPHTTGPVLLVADSQNNRIIKAVFDNDSHDPPVVTEFLTGLADPWDVVESGDIAYVSERRAHKINAYDAHTGAFIRTVVQGLPYASEGRARRYVRNATLTAIQAQPVCAPEGIALQDGWLYYGSYAMGQVKRVNLETGAVEFVANITIDDNSQFAKIALSDGTFGPRGTVFVWTWSVANHGMPMAYLPGGTRWAFSTFDRISRGRGGAWESVGYGSAGAVGLGRLYSGSSQEGITMVSKALPADPAPNYTKFNTGQTQYQSAGLNLLHGHHGYGHMGYKPPFGVTPEIDHYLEWNGITPV